jgi:nucleotide-binding universal stress UspA family protein
MVVVVWVAEGVWKAAIDAARTIAPADAEVKLLHVIPDDLDEIVQGAFAGLFGRRRKVPAEIEQSAVDAESDLLAAAASRLERPAQQETRRGRIEREVVAATEQADLLVLSRDGDRSRLGPHSLGPETRFVLDHAACPVLLVWPGETPSTASIPPPPDHPGRPPHPPGEHPPGEQPPGEHRPPGERHPPR